MAQGSIEGKNKSNEPSPDQGDLNKFFGTESKPRQKTLNSLWKGPAPAVDSSGLGAKQQLNHEKVEMAGNGVDDEEQKPNPGQRGEDVAPSHEVKDEKDGWKSQRLLQEVTSSHSQRKRDVAPSPDIKGDEKLTTDKRPLEKDTLSGSAKRSRTESARQSLLRAAEDLAQDHHAKYDPSHDFHHVNRVRNLALRLARTVGGNIDLMVVELAALFHDLLDRKYLPPDLKDITALSHISPFFQTYLEDVISTEQKELVAKIMEHVSYSKEVKRINEGKVSEWEKRCRELHCVQDADKLDAMGAIGIMRCSAYSAVASRPLYIAPSPTSPEPSSSTSKSSSAIDHFREKLFKLEGMLKTDEGKRLGKRRHDIMKAFVEDVEEEVSV